MNEPAALRVALDTGGLSLPLWCEAARLGGRIAQQLRAEGLGDEGAPARALPFLERQAARAAALVPPHEPQPLDLLASALELDDDERTLLVLAGMADEHEGYAAAFAALHPRAEPRPTWGLFSWLIAARSGRSAPWQTLHGSALLKLGLVRLAGDGPLPGRGLHLAEPLWAALHGLAAWPATTPPLPRPPGLSGLDPWLDAGPGRDARDWLLRDVPGTVLLRGAQPAALRLRAQQLAEATGGEVFEWPAARDPAELAALLALALVRRVLPVLLLDAPLPAAHWAVLDAWPAPRVLAAAGIGMAAASAQALYLLDAAPLDAPAQRRLWLQALPERAAQADWAMRFPLTPELMQRLRLDLGDAADPARSASSQSARSASSQSARSAEALKARLSHADEGFARRILPRATWADLVLPPQRLASLIDAVARVRLQRQVLDDWGFAAQGGSHAGQRGLRMLFSGLPGTGKTLAAEVVAHALQADLLVIDLARLISKWIGETEKNLAAAFDQAEGTGTVLLFDEADALFGKRSEGGDAHDRYANIESSYLLARLERFDGVAILATNLRGNLDRAFLRRFELTLDFPEPGPAERLAIWQRQWPPQAPLAADVDLELIATRHALPGALIRSAALAAAYLAAGAGTAISRAHIERALAEQYAKTGLVCPP